MPTVRMDPGQRLRNRQCKWRPKRNSQLQSIRSPQQLRARVGLAVYELHYNMLVHVKRYNVTLNEYSSNCACVLTVWLIWSNVHSCSPHAFHSITHMFKTFTPKSLYFTCKLSSTRWLRLLSAQLYRHCPIDRSITVHSLCNCSIAICTESYCTAVYCGILDHSMLWYTELQCTALHWV